ncbi:dimethylarginine dimethylaminohydrolase family protein [Streptomyces griseomycini]|uniref:N-dimethylarginine dimethylaminohydrolase n=1 Tax=Streptomyces griseomycini TaxID=66895 RepID=A0A7W7PX46_9ACTN|nr:amidinotransferase [Streptomyces griseomycini]MBB4902972.1 N-dimethylarginine dimethylaminohydrolase [Streptomyces griseomycini]
MTSVPVHDRRATRRHYLMCRPDHLGDGRTPGPGTDRAKPVDPELALLQWEDLYYLYLELGHRVDLVAPVPGAPRMVLLAHGATVIDGKVLGTRFRDPARAAGAPTHLTWFRANCFPAVREADHPGEGEGDFAVTADWILAGHAPGPVPEGHREAQEFFGRPVISLELADPRFPRLDTALCVLGGDEIVYHPQAFTPAARAVLLRLFPHALTAGRDDAEALGLNAVCDGLNVVLPESAQRLAAQLRARGLRPHTLDVSELRKAGGGIKSCTQELRF